MWQCKHASIPTMRWALVLVAVLAVARAEIKLQSVDRKIKLNSQFARITESIKVKNTGDRAVDRVVLCSYRQAVGVLAFRTVTQVLATKTQLKYGPASPPGAPAEAVCIEVQLSSSIAAGEVGSLDTLSVWADVQTPFPAEIAQGEAQLVLYHDTVHVLSPYTVSAQTTEVVLPTAMVKSYTDTVKPVVKTGDKIRFGKYDLVQAWTLEPLRLHFDQPKHFKKALSVVKEVELSHWGNIYVEEMYELRNEGARHKGSFSRLKYAHLPNGQTNSFRDLKARLPASAHSLYYVDLIGNISTSTVRKSGLETILDFSARYPLMGGWKVDFKLGYSLPLKDFLFRKQSDGKRRLTLDLGSSLDGLYIEQLTLKVVLPEGASAITTHAPEGAIESRDLKFTYLDVTGRPVVVLQMQHVVPEHAAKVHVDYAFTPLGAVREPLLLVTAFAALFAMAILYGRLEFTISRDEKWQAAQEVDKIGSVMQQLNMLLEEQDEVLGRLLGLASGLHGSEDVEAVLRDKAGVEAAFSAAEAKVKPLVGAIATSQPRVAEKVKDLGERLRTLQQRCAKQLQDKCELVRKGTALLEANKKLAPTAAALVESRKELMSAVESTFAPY